MNVTAQFIGIDFQIPYLEAKIAVMKGSRKSYPHNGINFASAGSGVLRGTKKEEVTKSDLFSFGITMEDKMFSHLHIPFRSSRYIFIVRT